MASTEDLNHETPINHQLDGVDDDDEYECRICRGGVEEDRPLFKPCKCTGSIGWTHQDCLQSWLGVNHATKCELCGATFRFENQYAPDTPDRLPALEVLLGMSRNLVAQWLPLCLRVAVAATLWLIAAPLLTALIYHGWMNGTILVSSSSVSETMASAESNSTEAKEEISTVAILEMIPSLASSFPWGIFADELVSGAVLVAVILFSFLSLMSFVDFLRAEWQDPRPPRDRANNTRPGPRAEDQPPVDYASNVDGELWSYAIRRRGGLENENDTGTEEQNDSQMSLSSSSDNDSNYLGDTDSDSPEDDAESSIIVEDVESDDEEEENDENMEPEPEANPIDEERFQQNLENRLREAEEAHDRDDDGENDNNVPAQFGADDINNNENRPNDMMDDDPALDADINIALDELLGVRGPLLVVVRNLLWLLAFNTLYLALFAFIPRLIGAVVLSLWRGGSEVMYNATNITFLGEALALNVSNATTQIDNTTVITNYSVLGLLYAIENEGERLRTTFRLKDFGNVAIGYACVATMVVFFRYLWLLFRYKSSTVTVRHLDDVEDDELRETIMEMNRMAEGLGAGGIGPLNENGLRGPGPVHAPANAHNQPNNGFDEDGNVMIGVALDVVLEAAVSIVKVGVLLFLKMFLLPVMLGFCLDLSTLSLFQRTLDDSILYAGRDLFSFLFLHWVAGISFMLLVTVSVLQLREVAHPNVLSHVIRPQEPQPDLLGNLLHDPLVTHAKRLVLSLVIYALLLVLQVHIPIYLCVNTLFGSSAFFKLRFSYLLTPRLQIPIELCIFHLCMLAFLEKNKNSIGELQHYWLKFACHWMGFSTSLLPHEVGKFQLIGTRPVFRSTGTILEADKIWLDLANQPSLKAREAMIEEELLQTLQASNDPTRMTSGRTKPNGERVVTIGTDYIRLPTKDTSLSVLLPTKVGRFRLKRGLISEAEDGSLGCSVEVWVEILGETIARPPEGWDDLGVGGADVQGRWAWDREKRSSIEEGVARRTTFFNKRQSTIQKFFVAARLGLLGFFSWTAATATSSFLLIAPLVIGRSIFSLLRLPDNYTHDPFCFAIGSAVLFPVLRSLMVSFKRDENAFLTRFLAWAGSYEPAPLQKFSVLATTGVLWFALIPVFIGLSYDVMVLWAEDRFTGSGFRLELKEMLFSWAFGTVALNGISISCVLGVLTRRFWGALLFEDQGVAQERPQHPPSWQGANGFMARFWSVWKAAICDFEWEKVDRTTLLDDCALPIFWTSFASALVPMLVSVVLGDKLGDHGAASSAARLSQGLVQFLFLTRAWREQILSWFDAAHKTARDERYLIGQLLMNYGD